jgi:hypothetical protein
MIIFIDFYHKLTQGFNRIKMNHFYFLQLESIQILTRLYHKLTCYVGTSFIIMINKILYKIVFIYLFVLLLTIMNIL